VKRVPDCLELTGLFYSEINSALPDEIKKLLKWEEDFSLTDGA
jgi:hypothetical protein